LIPRTEQRFDIGAYPDAFLHSLCVKWRTSAGWDAGFDRLSNSGEHGAHQYLFTDKAGFRLETGMIELRMPSGQVTTIE